MAWIVAYRSDHKDYNGINWQIDIENTTATSITDLQPSGEPLEFNWEAEKDEYNCPIHDSEAIIGVISPTSFALSALEAIEPLQFRVRIYQTTGNLITGWANYSFTTFTSSGTAITSAIKASSGAAVSSASYFAVTTGEVIRVSLYLTVNSGTANHSITITDSSLNAKSAPYAVVAGLNDLSITITGDAASAMLFLGSDAATDISTGEVHVFRHSDLYWLGYLSPETFTEPYRDAPYEVKLSAYCGLKLLKKLIYDDSGAYYTGRLLESEIIIDILGKINHTGFTEYVNIYESNMDTAASDSPILQNRIDAGRFSGKYCEEVLIELLSKYNACIVHKDGGFVIYRPKELTGATVYGRVFTSMTAKTATSYTPLQYINRVINTSTLQPLPDSVRLRLPPAREVAVYQDWGYKKSWLNNYTFAGNTWNGAIFSSWLNPTGGNNRVSDFVPGEVDGIAMPAENTLNDARSWTTYQIFAGYALTTSDVIVFEFDYMFFNFSGGTLADVAPQLRVVTYDNNDESYLIIDDEETASWTLTPAYVSFTEDAPNGTEGWKHFKRKIEAGLELNGVMQFIIYGAYSPNGESLGMCYKNIQFYSTSDEVVTKTRKHKGWFPKLARLVLGLPKYYQEYIDNEERVQDEYQATCTPTNGIDITKYNLLGDVISPGLDNIIEQFSGSLAYTQIRVDTITLTGSSGTCHVLVGGVTKTCTWNTSLTQTATDYVTAFASFYDAVGITLTSSGAALIFTGQTKGINFYNFAESDYLPGGDVVNNVSGDLIGEIVYTTHCITPSSTWNSFNDSHVSNAEADPLLTICGDEIEDQTSRTKDFLQLSIKDEGTAKSAVNIIGCFEDEKNTFEGANRKFIFNRGRFLTKPRIWIMDLIEVIYPAPAYCEEYQAVYDAMTNKPTDEIAAAQNTMVETLVTAGLWDMLDVFYLFAQYVNTDSEALINWCNPGTNDCTLNGTPAFTSLEGFTGSSGNYIDSNYNPSTDAINFTLNDASVGIYSRDFTVATNTILYCYNGTYILIYDLGGTRATRVYINDSGYATVTVTAAAGICIKGRSDSNTVHNFINKSYGYGTAAVNYIPNANILFVYNSTSQVSVGFAGAFFNESEMGIIQDAIEAYMDSNGKGVIA